MLHAADLRREFRPMMRLAAPLALAELGWMAMGVVDTIMAGPLGAAAVGAGSLGAMMFFPIAICGTGLLLGMDTLVAQAFGRGDLRDCRRTLVNGVWLGAALSPLLVLVLWATIPLLRAVGTNPRALEIFEPYLKALTIGVLPLLLYTAFPRYLPAGGTHPAPPRDFGAVSQGAHHRRPAAAPVYRLPPLSAGGEPRQAHHVRAGQRQPHQHCRRLGLDVRPLRRSRPGSAGLRLLDVHFADLHGGCPTGRHPLARTQIRQPAVLHLLVARFRAHSPPGSAGTARRRPDPVRRRCVRHRNRHGRAPG